MGIFWMGCLTDDEGLLLGELVLGYLEVQGSGTLADTAGDIVVRTVARAEPAAVFTGLADGHTTQVGADTQHDQPLGLLHTLVVGLGVTQILPLCLTGLLDLILGTVTDEDGLATPLDDNLFGDVLGGVWGNEGDFTYVLALRDGAESDLNLGLGQDVGGGGHVDQEVCRGNRTVSLGNRCRVP
jgi:hypothetical protein